MRWLKRSTLFCISALLSGCLPTDSTPPECFPDELCPRGQLCRGGQCITPQPKELIVELGCLGGEGCRASLDERGSVEACLIIEQPHGLFSAPLPIDEARSSEGAQVSLPLMPSDARASVLFFTSPPAELNLESLCGLPDAEIDRLQLHRDCSIDQGCVLRLRQSVLSITSELLTASDPISLSFSGDQVACAESRWSESAPVESCGGQDLDCDGFFDEGVLCESDPSDPMTSP